jgi:ribosomal protein S18 acetylase RimI-like enzyme
MSGNRRYEVRRFDPERDLDAAYRCYVSGFHHNSWPIIDHAEPRLVKDLILNLDRIADAVFVAEVDGEARGVLAGYFPADERTLLRAAALTAGFQFKVLLRRYRMDPIARAAWWRMDIGFVSFMIRQPRSPAEVLMLCSQKEYRGGIGRAMMDAWVHETGARGYDSTIVNTDSTVSWDFYERYGFQRVREFPTKMFCYSLPGVDVRGYIYSLDIAAEKPYGLASTVIGRAYFVEGLFRGEKRVGRGGESAVGYHLGYHFDYLFT